MIEQSLIEKKQEQLVLVEQQQLNQQQLIENNKNNQSYIEEKSGLVNKSTIQKNKIASIIERENTLKIQLEQLQNSSNQQNEKEITLLEEAVNVTKMQREELTEQHDELQIKNEVIKQQLISLKENIAKEQGSREGYLLHLTQLNLAQQSNPDWLNDQSSWLKQQNIQVLNRYFESIEVESGWEQVVEEVLSSWITSQQVTKLPEKVDIDTLLVIYDNPQNTNKHQRTHSNTLASKVSGSTVFSTWLEQIYLAESLSDAKTLLNGLAPNESVICQDGTWLGHRFLRKGSTEQNNQSIQRIKDIEQVEDKIANIDHSLIEQLTAEKELKATHYSLDTQQKEQNQQIKKLEQQQQNQQQNLALLQQQQKHNQQQIQQATIDIQQLTQQKETYQQVLAQLIKQLQAVELKAPIAESAELLNEQKNVIDVQLKKTQSDIQEHHDKRHQLAIIIEQLKSQQNHQEQTIARNQTEIIELSKQQAQLDKSKKDGEAPLTIDESQLQQWLETMLSVNKSINNIQDSLNTAQEQIKDIESNKDQASKNITQLKEKLTKFQLDAESFRLRAEGALEQLDEMQQSLSEIQQHMPEEAKEPHWQAQIIKLGKSISQLGAINLAAIDEYESQLTRKNYLDEQNEDLTEAIDTLVSAIAEIDKESKQKFKVTFDQVNADLKALFPKVFGGGSAYLELTGEDLLDTGVTIMARPPGKKNSTIHLLSGGEKALTALSLVFAIFRLNPAPFCMLDEVDAPLDDANVERFCHLVKEMSQTVQFIYISHNKIAMEMASHLTGVTMFEAGVSRMVSVDIDEAIAMAEI